MGFVRDAFTVVASAALLGTADATAQVNNPQPLKNDTSKSIFVDTAVKTPDPATTSNFLQQEDPTKPWLKDPALAARYNEERQLIIDKYESKENIQETKKDINEVRTDSRKTRQNANTMRRVLNNGTSVIRGATSGGSDVQKGTRVAGGVLRTIADIKQDKARKKEIDAQEQQREAQIQNTQTQQEIQMKKELNSLDQKYLKLYEIKLKEQEREEKAAEKRAGKETESPYHGLGLDDAQEKALKKMHAEYARDAVKSGNLPLSERAFAIKKIEESKVQKSAPAQPAKKAPAKKAPAKNTP